jgi:hypothetical protein
MEDPALRMVRETGAPWIVEFFLAHPSSRLEGATNGNTAMRITMR